jgi:hypothetical protein
VGLLAFAGLLAAYHSNIRRLRRVGQDHPFLQHWLPLTLARAIGISVLLLLVLGMFGHNLYRYTWLWYAGFLILARHVVEQRLPYLAEQRFQEWEPWSGETEAIPNDGQSDTESMTEVESAFPMTASSGV